MIIVHRLDSKNVEMMFNSLIKNSTNLRPAFVAIEEEIINGIEDIFEQEGPGWAKLSPVTERYRESIGKAGKKLQVSGKLATSIHGNSTITPDSVTVGSNVPYAPHLHYGTEQTVTAKQSRFLGAALGMHKKAGSTLKNPARPFMLITNDAANESEKILADHLMNGI